MATVSASGDHAHGHTASRRKFLFSYSVMNMSHAPIDPVFVRLQKEDEQLS